MFKITYTIDYNHTNKMWCLFKRVESDFGYAFRGIFESPDKKDCQNKLLEVSKLEKNQLR